MKIEKLARGSDAGLRVAAGDLEDKVFRYNVHNLSANENVKSKEIHVQHEDPLEWNFMAIGEDSDVYCNWLEELSGD
ncbi:MAG: hypothetical protein LBI56_02035 [Puniceicoccales bacterium]|jgi:hypothetical protein|nr:hypothetical protein [Puniceicoccales bacterium]